MCALDWDRVGSWMHSANAGLAGLSQSSFWSARGRRLGLDCSLGPQDWGLPGNRLDDLRDWLPATVRLPDCSMFHFPPVGKNQDS